MRKFDAKLVRILKTEIPKERSLKADLQERERFAKMLVRNSGKSDIYQSLNQDLTVARAMRYAPGPPYRSTLIKLTYVVSGSARVTIGDNSFILKEGDILIPNQFADVGRDPLGGDDILLDFIMKPKFVEDICICLHSNTMLSEFMLATLKEELQLNCYLHFTNIQDPTIINLIETMAYIAYPYLSDENMSNGFDPEPKVTKDLMCALFSSLSRNLESLSDSAPVTYQEVISDTVTHYINSNCRSANLQEMAALINQSTYTLSREIKSIFGKNFKDLLLEARIERAKLLLSETELPVSDVSRAVGYENTSYFHRRFLEHCGMTPHEFRQENALQKL